MSKYYALFKCQHGLVINRLEGESFNKAEEDARRIKDNDDYVVSCLYIDEGLWFINLKNQIDTTVVKENPHQNNLLHSRNQIEFQRIFSISLSSFFSPLFGFDIVKFDKFLKVPFGISMEDYILNNYNQKAVDLIRRFL